MSNPTKHVVPINAQEESCGMCYREGRLAVATHKVGEQIVADTPNGRHRLTQYVCCKHFGQIVGDQSAITWRGCPLESLTVAEKAGK